MSRESRGASAPPQELRAGGDPLLERVHVSAGAGAHDYPVVVGPRALEQLPALLSEHARAHRWAVISDQTVASLHGADVLSRLAAAGQDARLFSFPAGERHKTRETWGRLTDALLEAGYGRDSAVLAVGGGVVGDLAGFVAATYLRGVPVVQVPTSLVAMIDASVGGKTGVDTAAGKNLVGAFHPPRLVVVDPETARSLPTSERAQGLVEALKHGFILDAAYLESLEADLARLLGGDVAATHAAVLRSVQLKAHVVSRDERELGYRQILNFGHTLGHALEAASQYRLPHGSAVAVGMVLEARLGERLGCTETGTSARVRSAVEGLGLAPTVPAGTEFGRVVDFLASDKKRREGAVRYVLLRRVGEVVAEDGWSQAVPPEVVESVLKEVAAEDLSSSGNNT